MAKRFINHLILKKISIGTILLLGAFLRFYKLNSLVPFIGDQGWFYLSARDLVLGKSFPLVGITSSHTWLHQGPFWTYILAFLLWISHFNPMSGSYLVALFGVVTVYYVYILSKTLFDEKVAAISAILYTTSPLIIIHSRLSYHTSLIPFFVTTYIFFLYKFYKGNYSLLPMLIANLAILYNFELATQVLWGVLFVIIGSLYIEDRARLRKIFTVKNIFFLLLYFFLTMLPIFLYDITHHFLQTAGFFLWIPYKIFQFFFHVLSHLPVASSGEFRNFLFTYTERFIFLPNKIIAVSIILFSISFFLYNVFWKKRFIRESSLLVILLAFFIPLLGLIISATPSEAYLPMLFPAGIIIIAWSLVNILKDKFIFIIIFVLLIAFLNIKFLLQHNYFLNQKVGYGASLDKRIRIAKKIIRLANGKKYNLIGRGEGSQFASFTMNYEYLTWWLGNPPEYKPVPEKIFVNEYGQNISVYKNKL